ncbi:hypothetical protein DB88DRAFT_491022 [Papiliotrema laurentii]|uniref:RRM Nup35-type domain-containing protein n=1 Tax=Papiliotrema laurentii TaxID=5418 RepID=A0AAD9CWR7_PAPLA|nr:hypothetical protein DB88DRAFT_491022 [Papiliotrema laurentii]
MSQDWWPTSSTSFSTPSRPQAHPSSGFTSTPSTHALGGPVSSSTTATNSNTAGPFQPFGSTSGRARFAGDELDPEDSKSAENVKFFPSFSSTPAGKAYQASGGVIAGGGGGSVGSPGAGGGSPGVRRSPQHRFSFGTSPNDAMSPRNRGATGRSTTQYTPQSPIDEDGPPTLSLRDAPSSPPPSSLSTTQPTQTSLLPANSSSFSAIPPPPGLRATSETTTLYVFGPPPDQLPLLREWLEECGQITAYFPAVQGGFYYQVTYASPIGASYALRRHGEIVGNKWMVGFKVVEPGQGVSPPDAASGGIGHSSIPGSRIVVQDKGNVIKPKTAAAAGTAQKRGQEGNGWDEGEAPGGIMNKAAEWLFGR